MCYWVKERWEERVLSPQWPLILPAGRQVYLLKSSITLTVKVTFSPNNAPLRDRVATSSDLHQQDGNLFHPMEPIIHRWAANTGLLSGHKTRIHWTVFSVLRLSSPACGTPWGDPGHCTIPGQSPPLLSNARKHMEIRVSGGVQD